MRVYHPYRDIRGGAVIFGLSLPYFALMMLLIVISLLVIIFSFGLLSTLGALVLNVASYLALIRISNHPFDFRLSSAFPALISNKKSSFLDYEED